MDRPTKQYCNTAQWRMMSSYLHCGGTVENEIFIAFTAVAQWRMNKDVITHSCNVVFFVESNVLQRLKIAHT